MTRVGIVGMGHGVFGRRSDATYRWPQYFDGEGMLTVTSGQGITPMLPATILILR